MGEEAWESIQDVEEEIPEDGSERAYLL